MALYTPGEVLFLLSLTREEAIDVDASQPDSCAHLSEDPIPSGDAGDDAELFTIARWHDVHDARRRIVHSKRDDLLLQLRARDFSQEEIAAVLGSSQPTVSRRIKATLRELLDDLGADDRGPASQAAGALERALTEVMRGRASSE